MHLKRWLTAIIALPILIYIVGPGPRWLFQLLVFSAAVLGLLEFYALSATKLPRFITWSNTLTTFLLFLFISLGRVFLMPGVMSLWVLLPLSYFMLTYPKQNKPRTEAVERSFLASTVRSATA